MIDKIHHPMDNCHPRPHGEPTKRPQGIAEGPHRPGHAKRHILPAMGDTANAEDHQDQQPRPRRARVRERLSMPWAEGRYSWTPTAEQMAIPSESSDEGSSREVARKEPQPVEVQPRTEQKDLAGQPIAPTATPAEVWNGVTLAVDPEEQRMFQEAEGLGHRTVLINKRTGGPVRNEKKRSRLTNAVKIKM